MKPVRVTVAVAATLRVFLQDTSKSRYGYELMRETGFPSGKLYPILARLETAGWLERLEPAASSDGPPRVGYRIPPYLVPDVRGEVAAATELVSGTFGGRGLVAKWSGGLT